MRPSYTRPSARMLRLGALLYAPITTRPPIVATKTKPAATSTAPQLDLAQPVEPLDDSIPSKS